MYCKNCGKALKDGDKFCSNCGAKAEREFIPAFRQSEGFAPQEEERKPRRTVQRENFNWDLDGYPTDSKRTEEVNFDWGSVLEEKQRNLFTKEEEMSKADFQKEEPEVSEAEHGEDEVSLEEAIFADMGPLSSEIATRVAEKPRSKSDTIDKFYTFNKKNEELQNLLDQEYERLRQRGVSEGEISLDFDVLEPVEEDGTAEEEHAAGGRHEEFDWTLPGDRIFRDFPEPKARPETAETVYVGVALSQPPKGYTAPEPEQKEELKAETEMPETVQTEPQAEMPSFPPSFGSEEPAVPAQTEPEKRGEPEQSKLTFDDVFGDDDDDSDEAPKKKGKALKVIAVILCLLVVAELVMIGIQYFAPNSAAGKMINKGYESLLGLFTEEEEQEAPAAEPIEESETAKLIDAKIELNKNVAAVSEDPALVFADGEDYGFEGFDNAYTFADEPWYEGENGENVTYGGELIGTVIQYYSSWVDKINGKNDDVLDSIDDTSDIYEEIEGLEAEKDVQYGINKLSIGEIRAGGSGFYVLTSVAVLDSETNKEKTEKQIVYLEPVDKSMKIVDIKVI